VLAAQGRTVDTAHAVVGVGIDAAGTYVALTRGRERNTAWAVTTAVAAGAEPGEAHDVQSRTARAVLDGVLEQARQERSALAEREQAEVEARSVMTHVDRLIEEVARLTAGRMGAHLDRLAAQGAITEEQRVGLAADEAYESVQRLLRTVELAGHDPADVLDKAVVGRRLDGSRSLAQVLYGRIQKPLEGKLAPKVIGFADLIPRDTAAEDRTWLQERADAADTRRRELGAATAAAAPAWATETLGPVPEDAVARAEWEHKAGWGAAYRELAAHTDDTDPLGSAPPAGLADKHAVWHAAHTALDLPDRSAAEAGLTDGRLRLRVRALEREETWAPRYAGDELAATCQAAERHREDAELWAARAETVEDPTEAATLRAEADRARSQADALAERTAQLEAADEARSAWFAATAATRDAAVRARVELEARGVKLDDPDDHVTADEWLAAHRAAQLAEDPHREIHDEADLADDPAAAADAAEDTRDDVVATPVVETAVPDVRDTATPDPIEHQEPAQRRQVPTADETAAAVARAQTALAEIEARRQADTAREAEATAQATRSEELTRWAEQDRAAEAAAESTRDADDVAVLQR